MNELDHANPAVPDDQATTRSVTAATRLHADLRHHGRRYATNYPPHDHSDHFPMAWLALGGLGATEQRRQSFATEYLPRLVPLPEDDPHHRRQQALLREMEARGVAPVVEEYLPRWVSGWYRDAYHPLIRIAYGVEFEVPEEVAAGLSYLEACGASDRLAALVRHARPAGDATGLELFHQAAAPVPDVGDSPEFTTRAEAAIAREEMVELAWVVPDNVRQVSFAALSAFASTHDFFALHLVTGSHAFRIVHRYAGPDADAILNLGLLAGYLAIGAPPIRPAPDGPEPAEAATGQRLLALCRDEHDIKLAYSALAQARHWQDTAYLAAAEDYLGGH